MNIPLYFDDDQIDDYAGNFKKGWKRLVKVLLYQKRHPNAKKINWLNQKRIERAIEHFNKCVSAYPRSWSSMWGLGKAHQAIGDHCEALEWFEKTYLLKPDLVDVALEASTEALRLGDATKALQYAEKALNIDHRSPDFLANHALALLLDNQTEAAFEEAQNALRLAPNSKPIQNVYLYVEKIINSNSPVPPAIDPLGIYRER